MDILTLGLGLKLGLERVLELELGHQDVPGLKNTGVNIIASGQSRQDVADPFLSFQNEVLYRIKLAKMTDAENLGFLLFDVRTNAWLSVMYLIFC